MSVNSTRCVIFFLILLLLLFFYWRDLTEERRHLQEFPASPAAKENTSGIITMTLMFISQVFSNSYLSYPLCKAFSVLGATHFSQHLALCPPTCNQFKGCVEPTSSSISQVVKVTNEFGPSGLKGVFICSCKAALPYIPIHRDVWGGTLLDAVIPFI